MPHAEILPQLELVGRLTVAAVLGSLIGIERERIAWAAGLRTHMLVSVGACLVMIVSAYGFDDVLHTPNIALDPSRMAAQVVSGIGFMGAGYILLRGEIVRGLTTAASLWSVAAVGLAVGGGLYLAATAATLIILAILTAAKPLEEYLQHRNKQHELHLRVDAGSLTLETIGKVLGYRASRINRFICTSGKDHAGDDIILGLSRLPESDLPNVRRALQALPQVLEVA